MLRNMFRSKIHRATITHADVDYEGSVTIDASLMKAADIREFEAIHIWNITRGTRLVTYAMRGQAGSGVVCVNGAAAHLNKPGDLAILATFAEMDDAEISVHRPFVVLVDGDNRVKRIVHNELAGPNLFGLKRADHEIKGVS